MATLILSAVGTAVGGPIGGAIGALVGRSVDTRIIGRPSRQGPRLTELAVTTSSYGQPIPRIFGKMRLPGAIVWATDLQESSETSGGKGQPRTTTYSYAISFAVALSSRPISGMRRVWADGSLLRGAAGDLKVGGTMRLYRGLGDEAADPLIAAELGSHACGFRGLAYVVFENLDLASFGNRIPALSFEVETGDGALDLVDFLDDAILAPGASVPLDGLTGFADEGGTRADLLSHISGVFPHISTATEDGIGLAAMPDTASSVLPPAIVGRVDEHALPAVTRRPVDPDAPAALRYYDAARDYQASVQRAPGSGAQGSTIEFAGVFGAGDAQSRIAQLRQSAHRLREWLSYRIAEPTSGCAPGQAVYRTGDVRSWLVRGWEWHSGGVDLMLQRIAARRPIGAVADPGAASVPLDALPGTLRLRYFEMPWDGTGAGNVPQRYAAVSQTSSRASVTLSGVEHDSLIPLGLSARGSAVLGESTVDLAASAALVFEPAATLGIALSSGQAQLQSVDERALLDGANRLRIGEEIVQFRVAEPVGDGHWMLSGLLRGRGGTEHFAASGHPAGSPVILLDRQLLALPANNYDEICGESGLTGSAPVYAQLESAGSTLRPLAPVHPSVCATPAGDPEWRWIRRARGSWRWLDAVDVPLAEEREAYRIGLGPVAAPVAQWEATSASFSLSAPQWDALRAAHPGAQMWVCQVGSHAVSLPTLLPS
ncbi:phage tail baseplate protein [Citromicrobium bathyomarinum]|uniref:GTA baseplate fiber-binding domain-containing protein n=1 Tax=Citromicrobium bathyomarinum TaxID=72174 RepID=UPI00315A73D3